MANLVQKHPSGPSPGSEDWTAMDTAHYEQTSLDFENHIKLTYGSDSEQYDE